LIKKKTIFVCGIDLNRRKELVTLSLGTAALITRDKALIASENPPFGLPRKALITPNQGDVLVKAKVHREYCWDNLFLWPPQELVKFYTVEGGENFGIKTSIEVHQVIDPTYQVPEYTAYVIDDAPDWLIALPLDFVAEKLGSGEKLETAIRKALGLINVKPNAENIDLARKVFERWLNGYGAFTPLFLMPEVMDIIHRSVVSPAMCGGKAVSTSVLKRSLAGAHWPDKEYGHLVVSQ